MSRRTERVASLLRSVLADAIQNRLSDPRIEPLTSITRVQVSADLSVAHVYVSVMAAEPRQKLSVRALRHAAGRLRSMAACELTLRQVPQLDFQLDDSIQRSFQTVQQLDRIMEELGQRSDVDAGPDASRSHPAGSDERRADGERGEAGEPSDPSESCSEGAAGEVHEEQEDT